MTDATCQVDGMLDTDWNFGHSDFDWCCDDGQAPSYLTFMVTEQGGRPSELPGHEQDTSFGFQAMGKMTKPLTHWLREFFPTGQKPLVYTGGDSNTHVSISDR